MGGIWLLCLWPQLHPRWNFSLLLGDTWGWVLLTPMWNGFCLGACWHGRWKATHSLACPASILSISSYSNHILLCLKLHLALTVLFITVCREYYRYGCSHQKSLFITSSCSRLGLPALPITSLGHWWSLNSFQFSVVFIWSKTQYLRYNPAGTWWRETPVCTDGSVCVCKSNVPQLFNLQYLICIC